MNRAELAQVYRKQVAEETRNYLANDEGLLDLVAAEFLERYPGAQLDERDEEDARWAALYREVRRECALATVLGAVDVLNEVMGNEGW